MVASVVLGRAAGVRVSPAARLPVDRPVTRAFYIWGMSIPDQIAALPQWVQVVFSLVMVVIIVPAGAWVRDRMYRARRRGL